MTPPAYSIDPPPGLAWAMPPITTFRIETPRLTLRPYELSHIDQLHAIVARDRDAHLMPWIPWARALHQTLAHTASWVAGYRLALPSLKDGGRLNFGIFEKSTDRILGGMSIHNLDAAAASIEAGYWLASDACGRGYAREATRHTISWLVRPQDQAGMGFRRVELICFNANAGSVALISSLGIRRERCEVDNAFVEGVGLASTLGWAVLVDEWNLESHEVRAPQATRGE